MSDLVVTVPKGLWFDWIDEGDAVAVTIAEGVTGFRGWRERWWDRSVEVPFPEWRTAGVAR